MIWEAFRSGDAVGFDAMVGHIIEMLGHARHIFDEAMSALVAGASPDAIEEDVLSTDQRINSLEREVRRELVVHLSVHGTSDLNAMLVLLMVSRKVERIGDQAKNLYDLSTHGVDLSSEPDAVELRAHRDRVSKMFGTAAELFRTEDEQAGLEFIERAHELEELQETKILSMVRKDGRVRNAVSRALVYRYLKRTVANLAGVVAGVVQPFDLIDYAPGATTEEAE